MILFDNHRQHASAKQVLKEFAPKKSSSLQNLLQLNLLLARTLTLFLANREEQGETPAQAS